MTEFDSFARFTNGASQVLTSPWMEFSQPWNELVLSWNAVCLDGGLFIEIRACSSNEPAPFLSLGDWSLPPSTRPRQSPPRSQKSGLRVDTDTLICPVPMTRAQARITLKPGPSGRLPSLKYLGFSVLNTRAPEKETAPDKAVWGTTLDTPERSQLGHPGASGWCSPTAVSMVLAYWAGRLNRPDLDHPVPEVARAVFDPNLPGTGNWPFNTAYAGSFEGMRARVARLESLPEAGRWIQAGVPLILSVSFDLLNGVRTDSTGHLVVLTGFTASGDPVLNDPWPNPKKANRVRRVYPRERVEAAWQHSHRTVYLIHPESWLVPALGPAGPLKGAGDETRRPR